MIPTKSDWKAWSVLERVPYVAQFAAAVALLPTVMFAWLGWREARIARTEQVQFFVAEKAPDLEITSTRILPLSTSPDGIIMVTLKNVGASPATKLQAVVFTIGARTPIRDTSSSDDLLRDRLRIDKGKEFPLPLLRINELESHIGWKPDALRVFRLNDVLASNEQVVLLLSVQFEGPSGDQHGILENIAATRTLPTSRIAPAATGEPASAAQIKR